MMSRPMVVTLGDAGVWSEMQVDGNTGVQDGAGTPSGQNDRIPCGWHIWNNILQTAVNEGRMDVGGGQAVVVRWLENYEVRGSA